MHGVRAILQLLQVYELLIIFARSLEHAQVNADVANLLIESVEVRVQFIPLKRLQVAVLRVLEELQRQLLFAFRVHPNRQENFRPVNGLMRLSEPIFHAYFVHLRDHLFYVF